MMNTIEDTTQSQIETKRTDPLIRLLIAIPLGALGALLWRHFFPGELPVRTDIIGYPIHSVFNVQRYFHNFYAVALIFPFATLLAFVGLRLVIRRTSPQGVGKAPEDPSLGRGEKSLSPAVRLIHAGTVGVSIAVGCMLLLGRSGSGFWAAVGGLTLGYVLTLALSARRYHSTSGREAFWDRFARYNLRLAPLSILGVYGASERTQVVIGGQEIVPYPWLGPLVAATLIGGVGIWINVRIQRSDNSKSKRAELEHDAVVRVAGSVLLYLLIAQLPGTLGPVDLFHEGESLGAARLTAQGLFPWRDLYFIHGPLVDVLSPSLGMTVFDESRWGAGAGSMILVAPAVIVSFHLLHAGLTSHRDGLLLIATPAAITPVVDPRMLLLPILLIMLLASLRSPRRSLPAILGIGVFIQAVLIPELAPFAAATWVAIAGFEAHKRTEERLAKRFRRTCWFTIGATASAAIWAAYLWTKGALGAFVNYYLTFARGHELTGGIPVQWINGFFVLAAIAPVVTVLIFWLFFGIQRHRKRLREEDWAMVALALFTIYYFRKFLSRADFHVLQPFAVSVPLILYLLSRGLAAIEKRPLGASRSALVSSLAKTRPLSVTILIFVLLMSPFDVFRGAKTLPDRFQSSVPHAPRVAALGYAEEGDLDETAVAELGEVLARLPNPSGTVFDFSNQPGLIHYFLGEHPSTRYYHVSMAIRRDTQADLVQELRQDQPGIVIYHGSFGQTAWDNIPNTVRHYDVSDFLLDHYRPVVIAGGSLVMVRNDIELPEQWNAGLDLQMPPPRMSSDLYFYNTPCYWGAALSRLERAPPPSAEGAINLEIRRLPDREAVTLRLPRGYESYDWLEIRSGSPFRPDQFWLGGSPKNPHSAIVFETLPRDAHQPYLVRVGNCPQWRGWEPGPVSLLHDEVQDIVSVRLLLSPGEPR